MCWRPVRREHHFSSEVDAALRVGQRADLCKAAAVGTDEVKDGALGCFASPGTREPGSPARESMVEQG